MKLPVARWAIRHRVLVLLAFVLAAAGGALGMRALPSGIYPEVDFPSINVVVKTGDAPPDVFQASVTRAVEERLARVEGVQRVQSTTIRGGAEVRLRFSPRADMPRAQQLVESALGEVRADLPDGAHLEVERLTPVAFPILSFNVMGPVDPRELRELADFTIRPAIARARGVGAVEVLGGEVREIEVIVDPEAAAAHRLRLEQLADVIRKNVSLVAVGRLERDRSMITVMASAEATSTDDLKNVPVALDERGAPIPLSSIAEVTDGAEDKLFRTSGPNGDAVIVSVSRLPGESTPEVVRDVRERVDALRPSLPLGVTIEPVYDQGELVGEAMASARDAILLGICLCLVVLGAFMRDVRAGLVAALAVPATLAITFGVMRVLGQTLNLMSLGGMAVSVGLVIDDAIVIVESVARKLADGLSPREAAEQGTHELAPAVVGTTATTVIVCVPLSLLAGIVGEFFGALATTLAVAVVVSLLVALFVVPIGAEMVMRRPAAHPGRPFGRGVGRVVERCARHPSIGIIGTAGAIGFVVLAVGRIPSGFLPTCDEGAFVIDYFTEAGTSLSDTDDTAKRIEHILRETPEVATFSRRTGAELGPAAVTQINRGDFTVRLKPRPRADAGKVIASVRARVEREIPGARVEFIQLIEDMLNDLSGAPRPLEVKIFGEDQAVLEKLAKDVSARVAAVPGAVDVYAGIERPSPQLVIQLDREATARLGLTPETVSKEIGNALLGVNAGTMRRFDRLVNIRVRYPDAFRYDSERIRDIPLGYGPDGVVGLAAAAKLETTAAPTALQHEGLQPVITVEADHEGRDIGGVTRDVQKALEGFPVPAGYRLELGGEYEGQIESQKDLARVAAMGVALVLLVLVAQFGGLRPAISVILTTPLALVGALAALWITSTPLNASSLMGCVLLVGLVVKNGILLVEVAEAMAREGVTYGSALGLAAERRARPIAMTTLATLVGLTPLALALGSGSEFQQPLAIAVLGGLTLSAPLSFLVLPSLAGMGRR